MLLLYQQSVAIPPRGNSLLANSLCFFFNRVLYQLSVAIPPRGNYQLAVYRHDRDANSLLNLYAALWSNIKISF